MKNLAFIVLIFAFSACKKEDLSITFNMNYDTDFTIESSFPINSPIDITTPEMETNSSQAFENNDTRADRVNSIYLKNMTINVTSPANRDLSFLNEIEIFVETDELPKKKLASKYSIPEDVGQSLELDVSEDNFEAYIKSNNIVISAKTVTDKVITSDTDINVDMRFKVNARLIK